MFKVVINITVCIKGRFSDYPFYGGFILWKSYNTRFNGRNKGVVIFVYCN